MNAQELKGLAVVAMDDAARIGRIDDLLFDTVLLRPTAIRIATDNGSRIIRLTEVRRFGPDAVVADTADVVAGENQLADRARLAGLSDLEKLKVVNEDGVYVGQIARVEVDLAAARVASFDVHKSNMLGIGGETTTLSVDQIVAIGPELVTVRHGA